MPFGKPAFPSKHRAGEKEHAGIVKSGLLKDHTTLLLPQDFQKNFSQDGYVLSCITSIQNDLVIQLPAFQLTSIKSVTDTELFESYKNTSHSVYELNPVVKKVELKVPEPTSEI